MYDWNRSTKMFRGVEMNLVGKGPRLWLAVKYNLKWRRIRNAQNRKNHSVLLEKHYDISILCVSYTSSFQGVFDLLICLRHGWGPESFCIVAISGPMLFNFFPIFNFFSILSNCRQPNVAVRCWIKLEGAE